MSKDWDEFNADISTMRVMDTIAKMFPHIKTIDMAVIDLSFRKGYWIDSYRPFILVVSGHAAVIELLK